MHTYLKNFIGHYKQRQEQSDWAPHQMLVFICDWHIGEQP